MPVYGATSSVGLWAVLLAKIMGVWCFATMRQWQRVERLELVGVDYVLLEEDLNESLETLP